MQRRRNLDHEYSMGPLKNIDTELVIDLFPGSQPMDSCYARDKCFAMLSYTTLEFIFVN